MVVKVLAGLLAAALATGAGVYFAFVGGTPENTTSTSSVSAESLPISEGSCCLKAMQQSCCTKATGSTDALAACAGTTSLGVTAKKPSLGCCDDE